MRVGVTNGGCAGMSYTMNYAEETNPLDEVVEDQGIKIFIEPKAILFLIGTEMDFETSKLGSRFTFRNPNETASCGCGESVSITPAEKPIDMAARPIRIASTICSRLSARIAVRRMFGGEGLFRDG